MTSWNLISFGETFSVDIIAGPYSQRVRNTYGLNLAASQQRTHPHDWELFVPDFGVPDDPQVFCDTLRDLLVAAWEDVVPAYIGCQGGIGRTGLALTCIVRAAHPDWSVDEALAWCRRQHHPGAVETPGQEKFIAEFPAQRLRAELLEREGRGHPLDIPEPPVKNDMPWLGWFPWLWPIVAWRHRDGQQF